MLADGSPAIGGHILETRLAAIGVDALDVAQLAGDHFANRALDAAALGTIVKAHGISSDVVGDLHFKGANPVGARVKPLVEGPAGAIRCNGESTELIQRPCAAKAGHC